ncbi:MAG: hypothetical protein JXR18_00070 [Neptuniibacter sp.]
MDFVSGFFSFPVAVAAVPFLFLFLLMLISVFTGLVDDLSFFGVSTETDLDFDTDISGTWLPVGITQVPLAVSLTTVTFVATVVIYYLNYFLLIQFTGAIFYLLSGAALALTFFVSLYIASFLLKPLMPLFDKEKSFASINYVGMSAVVRSNSVTEAFGEAVVTKGSLENQLDIYSECEEPISYGDEVIIISLNPVLKRYLVIKK